MVLVVCPPTAAQETRPRAQGVRPGITVGEWWDGFVSSLCEDSWAAEAHRAEKEHLTNVATLLFERGDGIVSTALGTVGILISDVTGATELTEATITGDDLAVRTATGDYRELTTGQRVLKGVSGALKLGSTAVGGAGAINGVRVSVMEARAATAATSQSARIATQTASGHGEMATGFFRLPKNVSVRLNSAAREGVEDIVAHQAEKRAVEGVRTSLTQRFNSGVRVYKGGQRMPEHVLLDEAAGDPISIYLKGQSSRMTTVTEPTRLSSIVEDLARQLPGEEIFVEWAACRTPSLGLALTDVAYATSPLLYEVGLLYDAASGPTGGYDGPANRPITGADPLGDPDRPFRPGVPPLVIEAEAPEESSERASGPATSDAGESEVGQAPTGGADEENAIAIGGGFMEPEIPPIDFAIRPYPDADDEEDDPRTAGGNGDTAHALLTRTDVASAVTPSEVRSGSRNPAVQLVVVDDPGTLVIPSNGAGSTRLVPGGAVILDPDLLLHVVSEGGLGGDAIRLLGFNGRGAPVSLEGGSLVLEPVDLEEEVKARVLEKIHALAGESPWTRTLDAYCLERVRIVPDAGTVFRIASEDLQQRFAPLRSILDASRRLQESGLLNPDSDPEGYFHSIRQWAIWTLEEGFDADGFTEAFLEHTKKNVSQTGADWTDEVESAVRSLVPNRWRDVVKVLEESGARTP